MFDIITARDFLSKLEAEYADFKAQPASARHALNCTITAYHLHEWVWGDWLKGDYATWRRLSVRDIKSFEEWLDRECPGFALARNLANGAKHFNRTVSSETQRVASFGEGPYGVGPYGTPYLLIDYGTDKPERWTTGEQLMDEIVTFWRQFFQTYRPEKVLDGNSPT
jgi:hypothetical protein